MRLLVALALVCCIGFAYSQPPPPSGGKGIQKQNAHATQPNKDRASEPQGTASAPLFVQSIATPETADEAAHKHYEHHEKPTLERLMGWGTFWLAVFTLILMAATIVLAVFTFRLWRDARRTADAAASDMRESLRISQQAADAATASVASLIAAERAYVFAEITLLHFGNTTSDFGKLQGKVKFWNYGKTPAVISRIRAYAHIAETAPIAMLPAAGDDRELPPSLAIAAGDFSETDMTTQFDLEGFSDLKNLRKRGFFVGRMEYTTINRESCSTGFCWELVYRDVGSSVLPVRGNSLNSRT